MSFLITKHKIFSVLPSVALFAPRAFQYPYGVLHGPKGIHACYMTPDGGILVWEAILQGSMKIKILGKIALLLEARCSMTSLTCLS